MGGLGAEPGLLPEHRATSASIGAGGPATRKTSTVDIQAGSENRLDLEIHSR